jgi:hypothetical protein
MPRTKSQLWSDNPRVMCAAPHVILRLVERCPRGRRQQLCSGSRGNCPFVRCRFLTQRRGLLRESRCRRDMAPSGGIDPVHRVLPCPGSASVSRWFRPGGRTRPPQWSSRFWRIHCLYQATNHPRSPITLGDVPTLLLVVVRLVEPLSSQATTAALLWFSRERPVRSVSRRTERRRASRENRRRGTWHSWVLSIQCDRSRSRMGACPDTCG